MVAKELTPSSGTDSKNADGCKDVALLSRMSCGDILLRGSSHFKVIVWCHRCNCRILGVQMVQMLSICCA